MVLAALVLAGSCAPTAPVGPVVREAYLAAPPERIWAGLLVVLTDSRLPIENIDRASWFLRTREVAIPNGAGADSALACVDQATQMDTSFIALTVLLRPAADSTAVRMQLSARNRLTSVPCASKGVLEARLLSLLRQQIAR